MLPEHSLAAGMIKDFNNTRMQIYFCFLVNIYKSVSESLVWYGAKLKYISFLNLSGHRPCSAYRETSCEHGNLSGCMAWITLVFFLAALASVKIVSKIWHRLHSFLPMLFSPNISLVWTLTDIHSHIQWPNVRHYNVKHKREENFECSLEGQSKWRPKHSALSCWFTLSVSVLYDPHWSIMFS